jgi:predicted GIY-YIG superfamily endonuclease
VILLITVPYVLFTSWTRIYPPEKLLYQEDGLTRSEALVREAKIKALPRPKKVAIVQEPN